MANAVDILRTGGLGMPEVIVAAAGTVQLDLGSSAALVQKETGGRNIYGHDAVPTGGTYTKGGPVTRENYGAYRAFQRAGSGRMQGVGPVQLTYYSIQDQADADGGCWEPGANLRTGFRTLAGLMRSKGDQDGARAYNGAGSAAQAYGRDFIAKRSEWRRRLAGAVISTPAPPAPGRPTLTYGAGRGVPLSDPTRQLVLSVQRFANRVFPSYAGLDEDGVFLDQTAKWLREFQRRVGIPSAGIPAIGPNTWTQLERAGYR